MKMHETLMAQFPVRRSKEEKQQFRAWTVAQMKRLGWDARTETTSRGGHQNVVIGDPEHAAVVFSAHYDTPADMLVPNLLLPRNWVAFVLYQVLFVGTLLLLGLLCGAAVGRVSGNPQAGLITFLAVYFCLLVFLSYGRSNPYNANDNTSGVAAVLQLAAAIPEEQRGLCAFILFDNEERGKQGSRNYARDHLQQQFMKLLVNLDCVGCGDHMLVISKDMARKCTGYNKLHTVLQSADGIEPHFYSSRSSICNSDQKSFKCGVAVVACRRMPVLGYVTGRIHTRRDTVCQQRNLDYLTAAFARWMDELHTGV